MSNKRDYKKNRQQQSADNNYARQQPQAVDVEKAILGALIIDKYAFDPIKHRITEDSFYDPRNQMVFNAIKCLADKGHPIDILTVTDQLEKNGDLEEVGGPGYVADLSSRVASSANIEYHANIIAEKQLQRLAIKIANDTETKAYDVTVDIQEELMKFRDSMDKLCEAANNVYEDDFEPLTMAKVIEEEQAEPDGLESQYYVRDKDGNDFNLEIPAKQLTLIGAQTSHGKSRMLENLTVHMVEHARSNEVILYYTFEESRNMVFEELLSIYTAAAPLSYGRNIDTIRKKFKGNNNFINSKADVNLFNILANTFDAKQQKHLRIINKPYTVEEIMDNITFLSKRFEAEGKYVKAVFIDYVQLLRRMEETGNTKVDISYIMRRLQDFAVLKAKLPIILAAQLNRSAGSPLDLHNQNMADASDIEHNAGMVIMEWNSSFRPITGSSWDKPENKSERERLATLGLIPGQSGKMYVLITKWRGGPRGTEAVLDFNQNTGLIIGNEPLRPIKNNSNNNNDYIGNDAVPF